MNTWKNYICKWPDHTISVCQARSRQELLELLDEISDPGSCEIKYYPEPLGFEVYPQYPFRSKRDNKSYVIPEKDTLSSDCLSMFMSGEFSDVTIRFRDESFSCHKCILVSRCERFKALFSSGCTEAEADVITLHPCVESCTTADIRALIYYIYSSALPSSQLVQDVGSDDLYCPESLLQLADEFLLPRLRSLCEQRLVRGLPEMWRCDTPADKSLHLCRHIDMFVLGRQYSAPQLADVALYELLTHEEAVRMYCHDKLYGGGGEEQKQQHNNTRRDSQFEPSLHWAADDIGSSSERTSDMMPLDELKMLLDVARQRYTGRASSCPVRKQLEKEHSAFSVFTIDSRQFPYREDTQSGNEQEKWESKVYIVTESSTDACCFNLFQEISKASFPKARKCCEFFGSYSPPESDDDDDSKHDDDDNDDSGDDRRYNTRLERALLDDRRTETRAAQEAELRYSDIRSRANEGDAAAAMMLHIDVTVPLYNMAGVGQYVPPGLEGNEDEEEEDDFDMFESAE